MTDGEHTREILRLDSGEDYTLVLDDGTELDVVAKGVKTTHRETIHIMEENRVHFEDAESGDRLMATITDGLRGDRKAPPFPWYTPLFNTDAEMFDDAIPDGAILGYVVDVR